MLAGQDEADHEAAKDGVDADDGGEEGRSESDEKNQGDDALRGPVLDAAGAAEEPVEPRLDGVEEEEHVAGAGEEDPQGGEAAAGVDEGDTESEEDPAWVNVSIMPGERAGKCFAYPRRRWLHQRPA